MKTLVLNIQKFSLNDGPGIRTVVFFKGCPLRCKWCANPESQSSRMQILWDPDNCIRCGRCAGDCPEKAVFLSQGRVEIRGDLCSGCGLCVENCPGRALRCEGKWHTVEDVLDICLQDLPFYEESGGGVTLSGGEPLLHPDFSVALLEALRARSVHTAIETTGFAPAEVFDRVASCTRLLLFDMKHWDEQKHLDGTGVSNRLILENMKRAVAAGIDILPRIPVVPNYNSSPADAAGFCRRLREVGLARVQLLPFHQFGEKKYTLLGRDYAYANVSALHEEELASYREVFLQNQIQAFF